MGAVLSFFQSKKTLILALVFIVVVILMQFIVVTKTLTDEAWGYPFYMYLQVASEGHPVGYMVLQHPFLPLEPMSQYNQFSLLSVHGSGGNVLFWGAMLFFCYFFFTTRNLRKRLWILGEMALVILSLPFYLFAMLLPVYLFALFGNHIDISISSALWLSIPILVAAFALSPIHRITKETGKVFLKYFLGILLGIFILNCLFIPLLYFVPHIVIVCVVWPILFLIKIHHFSKKFEETPVSSSTWRHILPVVFLALIVLLSLVVATGEFIYEDLGCIGESSSCNG